MTSQIIISIPSATANTVIFQFDKASKKFDSSFYSPALTDGKISLEEINQALKQVETAGASVAFKIRVSFCWFILLILIIISLFVYTLNFALNGKSRLISFAVFGYPVAVFVALILYILQLKRFSDELKYKCKLVVERLNPSFSCRGLRWHIPADFPQWIELWKDYQIFGKQSQSQSEQDNYPEHLESNIYIPPSQILN